MQTKLEKVRQAATDQERQELDILEKAQAETMAAYQKEFTAARKRDWDAAREGLSAAVERLNARYFSEDPTFSSLHAAVKYLQEQGYKVKKTKVYDDRKKGLITVQPDGTVRHNDVMAYAANLDKITDTNGNVEALHEEKSKMEIKKLKEQIEKLRFDRERDMGKYILKKDFGVELAARAGVLEAGLKHLFQTQISEWIALVGGNPKKAQMWLDLLMAALDEHLNQYASMDEFHVVFEKEA